MVKMGLILNFFKDINDETNSELCKEYSEKTFHNCSEKVENGEYATDECFERIKPLKCPFAFMSDLEKDYLCMMTLLLAIKNAGIKQDEYDVHTYDLLYDIKTSCEHLESLPYFNTDFENQYEWLSNQEFLNKYNFTKEQADKDITILKNIFKFEVEQALVIESFLDTLNIYTKILNESINNFIKQEGYTGYCMGFGNSYSQYGGYARRDLDDIEYGLLNYISRKYRFYDYSNESNIVNKYVSIFSRPANAYRTYELNYEKIEDELSIFYYNYDDSFLDDFVTGVKSVLNVHLSALKYLIEEMEYTTATYFNLRQGQDGEDSVYNYLKEHLPKEWEIISNINIPYKDGQRENDMIVISEKGIFTIEVKNYKAGYLEIKNDGRVIHSIGKEIKKDKQNIIEQSENHVTAIVNFMDEFYPLEDLKWYNLVKGVVVVSNEDMKIDNESAYPIFRTSLVKPYMLSQQDQGLTQTQIQEIKELLVKNSKDDVKFKHLKHFDELLDHDYLRAITQSSIDFMNKYRILYTQSYLPLNLSMSFFITPRKKYETNRFEKLTKYDSDFLECAKLNLFSDIFEMYKKLY